jgi:hypothetical protein
MHLSIDAAEPRTHWRVHKLARTTSRVFERCQGFTLITASNPPRRRDVRSTASLDVSEFNYLWLRKTFGSERAERAYWQARKLLPKKT